MLKLIVAGVFAAGLACAAPAAPAMADTDSITSWGNDNLGGSLGTTGGSVAIGGIRTTVDGFGTFDGSLQVAGPGYSSRVDQHYRLDGLETELTIVNDEGPAGVETTNVEGYLYYNPARWATLETRSTTRVDRDGNIIVTRIVCDPICH